MSEIEEHICIISIGYPTNDNPVFTFVDQLVCALSDLGLKCTVISPQSITKSFIRRIPQNPTLWSKMTKNNTRIQVYQPKFISLSDIKIFGFELGEILSELLFERAVKKAFKLIKEKPTIMYGHFWSCGLIAAKIARKEMLSTYVACGEGELKIRKGFVSNNEETLSYINGVISVSSENKNDSIKLGLAKEEKIIVIPNGIDQSRFYKINKSVAREALGYSENDFIVAYTGWFSERKGSIRVSNALNRLGDVKSIFIGSEEDTNTQEYTPNCEGILFCGRLPHQDIVKYLNCADVFVLPTLAEGCCNSIIEAMACGLPIISSNLPCNDDILNENNSIRINPQSDEEIAKAIAYLRDNSEERERMSEASLSAAGALSIEKRAISIFNYIMETK